MSGRPVANGFACERTFFSHVGSGVSWRMSRMTEPEAEMAARQPLAFARDLKIVTNLTPAQREQLRVQV